jgi:tripartite-type tricarboxylate transporter receptor subunit TctC
MDTSRRNFLAAAAAVGATLGVPSLATAQSFPDKNKPIRGIVPFPVASVDDQRSRRLAKQINERQTITVALFRPNTFRPIGRARIAKEPSVNRRSLLALLFGGLVMAALPLEHVRAAGYPAKPVKLVIPFAPGGTADFIARVIGESLSRELGQPVVIDNKAGAGGILGTMEVVRAPADGYTLVMATPSVTGASPAINPQAGYDPMTDLTPITIVAAGPTTFAVRTGFPAKNFQEFLAEVKKNPDKYTYATPGVGGIQHLNIEYFKSLTGTSITHVPFRGAGPAMVAVTSGQVDMLSDALPSSLPFINSGKLIPLVVSSNARVKELPHVPTFAEVGLPQLNHMSHFGILGPKGLPQEVVDKVNAATKRAVNDPAVRRRLEESGVVVVASSPQEFAKDIKELYTQLKKVVADRKLTVE